MTGFKDKLKDALSDFVEFDAEQNDKDGAQPAAPKQRADAVSIPRTAGPDLSLSDPEMVATLEHAVARSTEPGCDANPASISRLDILYLRMTG